MKNIGDVWGDFDGWIYPFLNCSLIRSSTSSCSFGDSTYTFDFFSWNPNLASIAWSHSFCKDKHSNSFFLKTERYLWNLLGSMSSTDFSTLVSSPMSRLSLPHIHQIDLYNSDWSYFSIMISSTTFGISASISSSIVTDSNLVPSPTPCLLFLIHFCLLPAILHSLRHLVISTFSVSQSIFGLCLCNHV